MIKNTLIAALVLIVLGLGAAMIFQQKTALIPAYFGAPLLLCGLLSMREAWRKHAMHAASIIALLGTVLPGFMLIRVLIQVAGGGEIARPIAVGLQAAMAVVCGVFLVLCIQSFIQARRNRAASSPTTSKS